MKEPKAETETDVQQLKIRSYDPNEVDVKDFKFKRVKDLRQTFRRAERILSIDDPDNPGEPIYFHLRALTLSEENSLQATLLTKKDMQALVKEFTKRATEGEPLDTEETTQLVADKVHDGNTDATQQRFLRKIQMGIMKPKVSLQWLEGLNPVLLELLHDTIDDLRLEQELWIVENTIEAEETEGDDSA